MAYVHKVLIAFDQFVNVVCGGHDGETISAHWGRMRQEGKLIGRIGSWVLSKLQRKHVEQAIAGDARRAKIILEVEEKAVKRE